MKKNDALKTREFYQSLGTADDHTIGRRFGLPATAVAYERRKLGIPNVRKKHEPKKRGIVRSAASRRRRDELLRKYEELGTYQKVAEACGISRQRAHQIINGTTGKDYEKERD